MAFVEALRSTACNVTVISESAYVVNEFATLQLGVFPSKHRDLWAIVRRCMRSRPDRRIRCLNKVKAHTTEEDLAVGRYDITRYTRDGNKLADTDAGEAAKRAAIPYIEQREIKEQDKVGFLLLKRLVTIDIH